MLSYSQKTPELAFDRVRSGNLLRKCVFERLRKTSAPATPALQLNAEPAVDW